MCTDILHRQHSHRLAIVLQAVYLVLLFLFLLVGNITIIKWTFNTELLVFFRKLGMAFIYLALAAAFLVEVGLSMARYCKFADARHQDNVNPLVMAMLFTCSFVMWSANLYNPLGYFLLFCLAIWVPRRRVAWVLFAYFSSWIIIAIITNALGLSEDVTSEFGYGICHSFGFTNPNSLGLYLFMSVAFGWYLFGNRRKALLAAVNAFVAVLCFLVTGSRTAAVMIAVVVIFSMLPPIPKGMPYRVFKVCFTLLPLILAIVSILIGIILVPFDNGQLLDSNFACRFVEAVYAFEQDGVHLLPWDYTTPERHYYFDNAYVFWIFQGGLFAAFGFFGFAILTNWLAIKHGDAAEMILVACAAIYCCMERVPILAMLLILVYCHHSNLGKPACQEPES